MVAGLAARFDRALLFILEKLNQFSNGSFFDTKALLAGVFDRAIEITEPGRMRGGDELRSGFYRPRR